jgi:outer membrane protein TolC
MEVWMLYPKLPLLVLWLAAAPAMGGERLTLLEAMQRGRENAHEVGAAKARAEAGGERVRQARGFRLPALHLEENFIRTDSPAEVFALELNQERFSFAEFTASDPNHPSPLNTAVTRAELTLPLYTGGELSTRVGQAEAGAKAANDSATWAGNQSAFGAAQAYVAVSQAQEYAGLLEESRKTIQAHVELARNYVEQGMLVRSELLRAEVEMARIEDMLAQARGNARIAAANLAFRVGADQSTEWQLATLAFPAAPRDDLAGWLASASGRPDLAAARSLVHAGELEVSTRRAAFLPRVGIVARGDLVDDHVFGHHGESTAIMAQASLNLFAGGSDRAAIRVAEWDAKAGQEDVARFGEGVQLEVRQAWEEAATARARQATAARAVNAAREAERIVSERFSTGVVKMLDLLDAATARREAETRELVARAEANTAVLRLALVAGRRPEEALP